MNFGVASARAAARKKREKKVVSVKRPVKPLLFQDNQQPIIIKSGESSPPNLGSIHNTKFKANQNEEVLRLPDIVSGATSSHNERILDGSPPAGCEVRKSYQKMLEIRYDTGGKPLKRSVLGNKSVFEEPAERKLPKNASTISIKD